MRIDLNNMKNFMVGVLNKSFKNKKTLDGFNENEETKKIEYNENAIAYEKYVDTSIDKIRTGEYLSSIDGMEDTPVGHVIAFMGTKPPKHYLVCDGSSYNIEDYKHLANYMIAQFGSVNYFGGDGITSFCVPDLRNEFLRGATDENKSGTHQDATQILSIQNSDVGNALISPVGNARCKNPDSEEVASTKYLAIYNRSGTWLSPEDVVQYMTVRPTNTSVMYCIKYEPTYFATFIGNNLKVELLEEPVKIIATSSTVDRSIKVKLNGDITDYDALEIVVTALSDNSRLATNNFRINVKDIIYNSTNDKKNTNGRFYFYSESQSYGTKVGFSAWFTDKNNFFIYTSLTSTNSWNACSLDYITGIKEDYKKNGIKADRVVLYDAGSIPFTDTNIPIELYEDFTQFQGIRFIYTMNAKLNPKKYKATTYIRTDSMMINEKSDVFIGGFGTRYFAGHFNDGDNTFTIDEVREDFNDKIGILKIEGLRYDEYDKDDALYINDDMQTGDTRSLWSSKKTYENIKSLINDEKNSIEYAWSSKKISDTIRDQSGASCVCRW